MVLPILRLAFFFSYVCYAIELYAKIEPLSVYDHWKYGASFIVLCIMINMCYRKDFSEAVATLGPSTCHIYVVAL
jgi:hypothetical protein